MLAVERMDHIVILDIDLIVNVQGFLDKGDELLHFEAEELLDLVGKFLSQDVYPLNTRGLISLATALGTGVGLQILLYARFSRTRLG